MAKPESLRETVGQLLEEARRQNGLTVVAAAKALGVSQQAYNQWEKGRSLPKPMHRQSIAQLLGITIEISGIVKSAGNSGVPRVNSIGEAKSALGHSIRKARIVKRVKQKELAETVGVSQSAITAWETGRSAPSSMHLSLIEQTLGAQLSKEGVQQTESMRNDVEPMDAIEIFFRTFKKCSPRFQKAAFELLQSRFESERSDQKTEADENTEDSGNVL